MAKDMDGNVLKPGDRVGYKDDVEQYGQIRRINGEMLNLNVWDSERGQNVERNISSGRCWKED